MSAGGYINTRLYCCFCFLLFWSRAPPVQEWEFSPRGALWATSPPPAEAVVDMVSRTPSEDRSHSWKIRNEKIHVVFWDESRRTGACRLCRFPSSYLTSSKNLSSSRAGNWESLKKAKNQWLMAKLAWIPTLEARAGTAQCSSTYFICTPFLASTITKFGSMFLVISSKAFSGIISARKHDMFWFFSPTPKTRAPPAPCRICQRRGPGVCLFACGHSRWWLTMQWAASSFSKGTSNKA